MQGGPPLLQTGLPSLMNQFLTPVLKVSWDPLGFFYAFMKQLVTRFCRITWRHELPEECCRNCPSRFNSKPLNTRWWESRRRADETGDILYPGEIPFRAWGAQTYSFELGQFPHRAAVRNIRQTANFSTGCHDGRIAPSIKNATGTRGFWTPSPQFKES